MTVRRIPAHVIVTAAAVAAAISLVGCNTPPDTAAQPLGAPDTVFVNGKIATVDATFSLAEAAAVRDGKFVFVGSSDAVRELAGDSTRIIDLGGRLVVPGLADGHFHSAGGGPGVDLSRARAFDEVITAIRERVERAGPDEVVVTNSDWHEAQLKEQRLPYRRDLDAIAPRTAVVVVRGGHEYILNSVALRKWNITTATKEPPGGQISRYPDGQLNGELLDAAKSYVKLPPPPERSIDQRIEAMVSDFKKLHAAGLTSVRVAGTSVEQSPLVRGDEATGCALDARQRAVAARSYSGGRRG